MATGEREYQTISVFGTARGMDRNSWKGAIRDDQTTYSKNISTTPSGVWSKRNGYIRLNEYSDPIEEGETPAAVTVTGIYDNTRDGSLWVTAGTGVYFWGSGTFTLDDGPTAFESSGVRTSAVQALGNLYIVAGDDKLRYISGAGSGDDCTGDLHDDTKYIQYYHGHLWLAGISGNEHTVRCSMLDFSPTASQATAWPTANSIFSCKDDVMGIHPYSGYLIVGTKTTIEGISGYTSADFAKVVLSTTASCASHFSMQEVALAEDGRSALIWAGYDGIYMLYGNNVRKISWEIQDIWNNVNHGYLDTEAQSVVSKATGEYLLSVPYGSSTKCNMIICFNYKRGDFSIWRLGEDGNGGYKSITAMGDFLQNGKQIILFGDTQGFVYQLYQGNYDIDDSNNQVGIDAILATKWFDGGMPDIEKDFRKMYMWVEPSGNFYLDVKWTKDYEEDDDLSDQFDLAEGDESIYLGYGSSYATELVVDTSGFTLNEGTEDGGNQSYTDTQYDDDTPHVMHPGASGLDAEYKFTTQGYGSVNYAYIRCNYIGDGNAAPLDVRFYDYANDIWLLDDQNIPVISYQIPVTTDDSVYEVYRVAIPDNEDLFDTDGSVTIGFHTTDTDNSYDFNLDYLSLYNNSPLYDTASALYASGTDTKIKSIDLKNTRSYAIRFIFRNDGASETFKLKAFKIYFTPIQEFPA